MFAAFRPFFALIALLISLQAATAQQLVRLKPIADNDRPAAAVGFRDVYGYISFDVTRRLREKGVSIEDDPTRLLWQQITSRAFGSNTKKGTYVVTLEVKKGEEVVGRQILASYKIDSVTRQEPILGGFFGYDSVEEKIQTESATNWNGRLFAGKSLLVDGDNNVLKVELATYFTDTSDIAPKFFSATASMINEVRGLPILGIAANVTLGTSITQIAELLDNQFFGKSKRGTITSNNDATVMSFIKGAQTVASPKRITYDLFAPGQSRQPAMTIRVNFVTEPSQFANFDVSTQKFLNPSADSVLSQLKIGGKSLVDALRTHSDSSLREFATAWLNGEGYKGSNIATRCVDLRQELRRHFGSRDASAGFWALAETYHHGLKASHADQSKCVSDVKPDFEKLGLVFSKF